MQSNLEFWKKKGNKKVLEFDEINVVKHNYRSIKFDLTHWLSELFAKSLVLRFSGWICQINFNLIARLCRKASRFKKFFIRLHFKNFWYFYLFPFSSFLFSHFRIFLLHWLTFYWVSLQYKNFREGNF